jgi:hypothetical protein
MKTIASVTLVLLSAAASPGANLLVDPGFESNPLDTIGNVLGNFSAYQGVWGVEAATISGIDGGVTPSQGSKMLRMTDDGNIATQAVQVTDVSSYGALISSGLGIVNLSGLFNVDANVPAGIGGVSVSFFSSSNFGSLISGPFTVNLNPLDSNPASWETASLSMLIPTNTTWIMSQVAYSDASLLGNDGVVHPGYVDATDLRIVPAPSSIGLLALAAGVGLRRRR